MKAPKKNHQEKAFHEKKPLMPKETPIADFFRKVVVFGLLGIVLWFCYQFFWVGLQVEQTVKEVFLLEQSIRQNKNSGDNYSRVANLQVLYLLNQIDNSIYNENNPTVGKNRFGGAIVVQPESSGYAFSIEYAGVPANVCKKALKASWGDSSKVEAIRVGGRIFTWDDESQYKLPIPDEDLDVYCSTKNFKITFK